MCGLMAARMMGRSFFDPNIMLLMSADLKFPASNHLESGLPTHGLTGGTSISPDASHIGKLGQFRIGEGPTR
jgi:hypothetical protein